MATKRKHHKKRSSRRRRRNLFFHTKHKKSMARRKHRRHRRVRRRRSISGGFGTHKLEIVPIIEATVGAVLARIANNWLSKKMNPKLVAGVTLGAGILTPVISKNKIVRNVSVGVAVSGAMNFIQQLGWLSGICDAVGASEPMQMEYVGDYGELSGDDMRSVAGEPDYNALANVGVLDQGILTGDRLDVLAGMEELD